MDQLVTKEPRWLQITHYTSFVLVFVTVLLSFLIVTLPALQKRLSNGRIKLDNGFQASTRKGLFSKLLLEHIDDLGGDGDPVDIQQFWKGVGPDVTWFKLTNRLHGASG
jgi:hypothetical protein